MLLGPATTIPGVRKSAQNDNRAVVMAALFLRAARSSPRLRGSASSPDLRARPAAQRRSRNRFAAARRRRPSAPGSLPPRPSRSRHRTQPGALDVRFTIERRGTHADSCELRAAHQPVNEPFTSSLLAVELTWSSGQAGARIHLSSLDPPGVQGQGQGRGRRRRAAASTGEPPRRRPSATPPTQAEPQPQAALPAATKPGGDAPSCWRRPVGASDRRALPRTDCQIRLVAAEPPDSPAAPPASGAVAGSQLPRRGPRARRCRASRRSLRSAEATRSARSRAHRTCRLGVTLNQPPLALVPRE